MKLIITCDLLVPDPATIGKPLIGHNLIPAGTHEVERVPNPWPAAVDTFIVLKGTQIGAGEQYLRSLEGKDSAGVTYKLCELKG
ncbi:MAG: hypothetical protein V4467_00140 [Patescibacteria group bacterium]